MDSLYEVTVIAYHMGNHPNDKVKYIVFGLEDTKSYCETATKAINTLEVEATNVLTGEVVYAWKYHI